METVATGYTLDLNEGAADKYIEVLGITQEREDELKKQQMDFMEGLMKNEKGEMTFSSKEIFVGYLKFAKNEKEAILMALQAGMMIKNLSHAQEKSIGGLLGKLLSGE